MHHCSKIKCTCDFPALPYFKPLPFSYQTWRCPKWHFRSICCKLYVLCLSRLQGVMIIELQETHTQLYLYGSFCLFNRFNPNLFVFGYVAPVWFWHASRLVKCAAALESLAFYPTKCELILCSKSPIMHVQLMHCTSSSEHCDIKNTLEIFNLLI